MLFNDHFEIPKYKNGSSNCQDKKQQSRYINSMCEIYGEEYKNNLSSSNGCEDDLNLF